MNTRQYTKRKRAQQEEETRQRIVEAIVDLHGSVGPRHASIRAVAEKAGVQRLTVYRHFPDQDSLFRACTSHWLGAHPPPDPAAWREIDDAATRRRTALGALYAYYRQTAEMWRLSYRDVEEVPALQAPMAEFESYLDDVRDDLVRDRGARRLRAVIGHAVRYRTWESLSREGVDDTEKVELVMSWAGTLG